MQKFKRLAAYMALVLCFITAFLPLWQAVGGIQSVQAAAAATPLEFDKTNVLDDLRSSSAGGKQFNINDYPYDSTGAIRHPSIVNVVEYCYSFKPNMRRNYCLYLYFYNPQALNLDTRSRGNKVQMAVSYDAQGVPVSYDKFDLVYCSKAEEPDYKNLFYKFRVVDRKGADGKTIAERVNSNARRYDISGVEIVTYGAPNAVEYAVGGTYTFSGYSKGYGADRDAPSTLFSTVNELETVELQVRNTFYRTQNSSLGKDHRNQLDSVYFGVDSSTVEKYGKLQKIRAEWWEYKTTPIVVTSDRAMYDYVMDYVGVKIAEHDDNIKYSMAYNMTGAVDVQMDWAWNIPRMESATTISAARVSTLLTYLFDTNGADVNSYTLPGKTLADWIYGYSKSAINGYLPIKGGNISADLFADSVDAGRTRGHNDKTFDSDDKFDMLSYDNSHSGWTRFWEYFGQWGADTGGDFFGVAPIYEVKASDVSRTDAEVASRLFINPDDVTDFKATYLANAAAGKKTYIFRFAQTDYFCMPLRAGAKGGFMTSGKAYAAEQTVFLDFDIIELTFNRAGVYHVIPAVSSPIDIIDSVNPPIIPDGQSWWKTLLMIVLLFLLIVLFWPIVLPLLNIVLWLIRLPFRFIGWLVRGVKSAKKE